MLSAGQPRTRGPLHPRDLQQRPLPHHRGGAGRHHGRLVKSLGDGMLLEFDCARTALQAAFKIQEMCRQAAEAVAPDQQIWLRMGIQTGQVMVDENDVYGRDVNLAARLTTLAGPGEIIVSARTRERVERAMADLGFVRNEFARQLRAGRSSTLAYVMLDATNPFFTDVAQGIEEAAERADDVGGILQLLRSLAAKRTMTAKNRRGEIWCSAHPT